MLMPLTFGMDPIGAFIMFGGIYYGAMYGGSTTSILVKMPGEASSVMTAVGRTPNDRQRAERSGFGDRSDRKLHRRHVCHADADADGAILVEFALGFGPSEYFCVDGPGVDGG